MYHILQQIDALEGKASSDATTFEDVLRYAQQGEPEAQYHLGLFYDTGKDVERNVKEAIKWYTMAAEQNHGGASYYLARLYDTDTSGMPRNEVEAVRWYRKAAENNNLKARRRLKELGAVPA